MAYISCGVRTSEGGRISTKKRLKELAERTPHLVHFDVTSPYDRPDLSDSTIDTIATDVKLSVAGPDPYTSRKWYATIERGADGKVKVT